jgi:membrane fusion protein, multidrug efflux system
VSSAIGDRLPFDIHHKPFARSADDHRAPPADTSDQQKEGSGTDHQNATQKSRSHRTFLILGVIVLFVLLTGLVYYFLTENLISTDDAYTEGRAVSIAAKVSGYTTALLVDDNTRVKTGDVLLRIDQRDYINARDQARASLATSEAELHSAEIQLTEVRVRAPATLRQAQAQLDQARANQTQAQRDFRRQQAVDPRATTQQSIDQATASFRGNSAGVQSSEAQVQIASLVAESIAESEATVKQREAEVEQYRAALAQAELNLSYTDIRAPSDGKITMRNVERGTYVTAGQQLFYLVDPDTWVVANFKEEQLARLGSGQPVSITVDAYPKLRLQGHIDSVQQGSGARFSAFPAQNATGNFVKIVRRVPVKIIVDSGYDRDQGLPLGISVVPTVHVP